MTKAADGAPVRKKRFSKKVRTGCATCRVRRIKCDEAKPACRRCTSTGRKCDGYASITPYQPKEGSGKPSKALHLSLPGTPAERQAFYLYRTHIASLLVSSFDVQFWTHDLLQTAELYETVRHAVVALAAAYRTAILDDKKESESQRWFALDQYNKSIISLQGCIHDGDRLSTRQRVVILMVNLLFNSVCALQGLQREACLHLQGGLALLHEWKIGTSESDGEEAAATSIKLLMAMYMRLDTQARVIIRATGRDCIAPYKSSIALLDGVGGGGLGTVTEAFTELDRAYNRILQGTRGITSFNGHRERLMLEVYNSRRYLHSWESRFGWLLKGHTNQNTKHESEKDGEKGNVIGALGIHRHLVYANLGLLEHCIDFATPGCLEASCRALLGLIVDNACTSELQNRNTAFVPSGNLVEALYFVARYCPDTCVRQEAIEYLEKNAVIEGLWKSSVAANIATAAVD